MRLGRIAADLGMARTEEPLSDEAIGMLAEEAEAYLRAGHPVPWSEWLLFSAAEREAFIVAGDRVRKELAALTALALSSSVMMRAMLAGEDLEDAAVSKGVSALAGQIADSMGGGET